jgi:predicted PhzF superfamily epimerase YddE/YHI9/SAM-dependent methyltransferase
MTEGTLRRDLHEANRQSWNLATAAHNQRKRDQAGWLRAGGELLFPEELELLGDLAGKRLVHLQCNSGQDSLCLARRGAIVTGVDISDEAVEFALELSVDSGIPASFDRADVFDWFTEAAAAGRRFDLAFCSYGGVGWLSDLRPWARGIADILVPGGAMVLVEFHPVAFCFDEQRKLTWPYFGAARGEVIDEPEGVRDYVGRSGDALAPMGFVAPEQEFVNPNPAHGFAWTISDIVTVLLEAGLVLERLCEWPWSNGCRFFEDQVLDPVTRRWHAGEGVPAFPGMFGIRVRKPHALPREHASVPMFQIDAFADAPYAGNSAAVCVLESPLPDARMQALAIENNLSETAFLLRSGDGFDIRWFTPGNEVDLCGHATLAAAQVVFEQLGWPADLVVFSSRSGPLPVRRERANRYVLDFPARPASTVEWPAGLREALAGNPVAIARADYYLVEYATADEVLALRPDLRAMTRIPHAEVIVTAPGYGDFDFVSRFFAPGLGIDEDPVTGSAHCTLAPWWGERLGKSRIVGRQVSARGGTVACELRGDRVELAGDCELVLVGRIRV